MPDRPKLSREVVETLPVPARGNTIVFFAGAVVQGREAPRGFGVRITAAGVRSFVLDYRLRHRQFRYTIGRFPDWSPVKAVHTARELRQRVDRGENPLDDRAPPPAVEPPKTVAEVLDQFIGRHQTLRSVNEYASTFRRLVKPAIGDAAIYDLKRRQIADMLDKIEDENGATMADCTRRYLSSALNWYAARDDDFVPPMRRGMARIKPKERARDRVLSDDELRVIWPQLTGKFGDFCKLLLLTAQRRSEVAGMRFSEIKGEVWTIPAERYKTGKPNVVPLSGAALAIIKAQPGASDLVFASRVGKVAPASGKPKAQLDAAVAKARGGEPLPHWQLHDLRRTARTLMTRAGIRPDIAERVLGHALQGVEGVYDRHSYVDEKRSALEALAGLVERIINPVPENIVEIAPRRRRART